MNKTKLEIIKQIIIQFLGKTDFLSVFYQHRLNHRFLVEFYLNKEYNLKKRDYNSIIANILENALIKKLNEYFDEITHIKLKAFGENGDFDIAIHYNDNLEDKEDSIIKLELKVGSEPKFCLRNFHRKKDDNNHTSSENLEDELKADLYLLIRCKDDVDEFCENFDKIGNFGELLKKTRKRYIGAAAFTKEEIIKKNDFYIKHKQDGIDISIRKKEFQIIKDTFHSCPNSEWARNAFENRKKDWDLPDRLYRCEDRQW